MIKKKGQSTLEYVVILTAIVAAIVVVANKVIGNRVQDSLTHVGDQMKSGVDKIKF
ncbi:MAG: hypothetical protein MUF05_06640 [Candidatus Omnitrophica bacterium]|jgi:Flp pilus assembly pilin Flp|nr:hypothetical protein [Candidatus Omnitrophota bacterium]